MISSIFLSTILPVLVMDVSKIEMIDFPEKIGNERFMRLISQDGNVEYYQKPRQKQGVLFVGRDYECFDTKEQIAFAFNPTVDVTTASKALLKLTSEGAKEVNADTNVLYSHFQIWIDKDGSGSCTFDEVYSISELGIKISLDEAPNLELSYGRYWSVDSVMSYTYEYVNNYGERTTSPPQQVLSVTLESIEID